MTAFKRDGSPVPDALLKSLRQTGVALKGPLETHVGEGYRSINVYLRATSTCTRTSDPYTSFPGVHTPFHDVDLVIVRENTEDLYVGHRASGRARGGRERQGDHGARVAADRALRLRIRAQERAQVRHRDSQGQHHEAVRRPVSEVRTRGRRRNIPRFATRSRSSTRPVCAWSPTRRPSTCCCWKISMATSSRTCARDWWADWAWCRAPTTATRARFSRRSMAPRRTSPARSSPIRLPRF